MKKERYFSRGEILIWSVSVALIILSFCIFDRESYATMFASVIGITAILFNAKANPIGQALMIVFGIVYGAISYSFAYYGEMITYLGMTLPMAIIALITWLRNPYNGRKAEVTINRIGKRECMLMWLLTGVVTVIFYFILSALGTAYILPSTLSITTSFSAVYLTARRSPYFAVMYALNDIVLIILWVLASFEDASYISVVVCFLAFLINDIYSFINWKRIEKRQKNGN